MNEPSLYELLTARIRALEVQVVAIEQVLDFSIYTSVPKNKSTIFLEVRNVGKIKTRYDYTAELDGICAALDEEDPDDFWVGGTDGPDD